MKYFVIFLVLIGISLLYSGMSEVEARTVYPLTMILEDTTINQHSFITTDGGMPVVTIPKGQTISIPFKVNPLVSEPLSVTFSHSIETAIPDSHKTTIPNMKIEFEPLNMSLKPDESQILNVTITTMNYTQLGEHRITVTAQYPQGEPLLNTEFDVLVLDENHYENPNRNSPYPVPGGSIIAEKYPIKKQWEAGLRYKDLRCNEGHVLIQKYDGSPACVTESTKQKLIERGWTETFEDVSSIPSAREFLQMDCEDLNHHYPEFPSEEVADAWITRMHQCLNEQENEN